MSSWLYKEGRAQRQDGAGPGVKGKAPSGLLRFMPSADIMPILRPHRPVKQCFKSVCGQYHTMCH